MSDLSQESHRIFVEAIELPPSEWPSFLESRCNSAELLHQVQTLLDAHIRSRNFLAETAMEAYPNLTFPFGGQVEEFKIIRLLGSGGMGHVYLAEDTILNRKVALKIVGTHVASDTAEASERFSREARAAARLSHPKVVQVFRSGSADGYSYIAMEYIEGTTLAEWLQSEQKLPCLPLEQRCRRVANLIMQIADALEHAHRAGVIHRDVKPSNILLEKEASARLTDFGIARIATEETSGPIRGSVFYMSPEQARVSKAEIDNRSDIFSLGVVLYESICLQLPFCSETVDEHLRVLSDCTPNPLRKVSKGVPSDLSVICHKAIEKDPIDRYQSAAHFCADLRCFLDGMPILARPPGLGRRLKMVVRKRQKPILIVSVALLFLALVGIAFAYRSLDLARQAAEIAQQGQLVVTSYHNGANVSVRPFQEDMTMGPIIESGEAPFAIHVQPGLYRVIIDDRGSKLETTAFVEAGQADFIEATIPKESLLASMVRIPSGTYELGTDAGQVLDVKRRVDLDSFRISPTEVSNREYREYVLATGDAEPTVWPVPYDPSIDDLPVAGVTWDQANAYCRWRGVRLPTPNEWEAASRGKDGSLFPWGNEWHPDIRREESPTLNNDTYLEFARDVGSDPHLATDLNVFHMLSNVQEYTEGVSPDHNNGLIVKGRSWLNSPFIDSSSILILSGRERESIDRGFRVASSVFNQGE